MQPNNPASNPNLKAAAVRYAKHRAELQTAFIPVLYRKFGLTPLQAIEAGKLAHELQQGGDRDQP